MSWSPYCVVLFAAVLAGAGCAVAQTPSAAPAGGSADTEAAVILILDASGSMKGRVQGRTKWDVARETVGKVLNELPPDREIGLMAYGHKGGKCNDIELLTPPAKGAGPAIIQRIGSLQPRGETPLTESVRQAAKALKYQDKPATVVIVTDGIESCKGDPCALARDLATDGIDFTAHVIGFGLSEKEGAAVACLAQNTGGLYIAANDADQLKDALQKTVVEAPVDVPDPQPKPAPPPAPAPAPAPVVAPPPAPPAARPSLFSAEFENGVDLSKWEIVNENKSRYGVMDGRWVVAGTRNGMLDNPKKENLLLAKTEVPQGDFDLVAEFTATMGEGTSHVSIGIYRDEKNFVEAGFWRDATYNTLDLGVRRLADGQATEQRSSVGAIGPWHRKADAGSPTMKHIDAQGVRLTLSRRGIKVFAALEYLGNPPRDGEYKGPVVSKEVSIFGLEGRLAFKAGVWGCTFDFQPCGENIVRLDKVELRTP